MTPEGVPLILDFGIAMTQEADQDGLTGDLTSMGTPMYMAPEQTDAAKVTSAADRYAFGLMAYEILSGRLP